MSERNLLAHFCHLLPCVCAFYGLLEQTQLNYRAKMGLFCSEIVLSDSLLEQAMQLIFQIAPFQERNKTEDIREFFQKLILQEDNLFLLDGLDEVPKDRQKVIDQIELFANRNSGHVIVTSRPVGYKDLEDFTHYELKTLNEQEKLSLINKWAIYQTQASQDVDRAERLYDAFLDELKRNNSLDRVIDNPLSLTFVFLVFATNVEKVLPARRHEIYERFLRQLAVEWGISKEGDTPRAWKAGPFQGSEATNILIAALPALGWGIHNARPGSSHEKAVDQELDLWIGRKYKSLDDAGRSVLKEDAKRFWIDRVGLISPSVQGNTWSFLHTSIQEYLAAVYLSDLWQFHGFITVHFYEYVSAGMAKKTGIGFS